VAVFGFEDVKELQQQQQNATEVSSKNGLATQADTAPAVPCNHHVAGVGLEDVKELQQ
jgi:hypothetical protein